MHIAKFKKKYQVQRNAGGEIIKILYKGKYVAFEEDFEYFDYEIKVGQLTVGSTQQMIHFNEDKDPSRRSEQLIQQFSMVDGHEQALVNPFNPF